ncbi:GNAT family N-acetyltransferase [Vibrio metschnikovii]|uniref:GNAT family N-acetyltransferase n=1 Tax=Vibrio metschnikovii TaxID=28172 RepID=UPI001C30E65E|nr:GNAT family N-acetyltransferase [Vibrio metschnikovii]
MITWQCLPFTGLTTQQLYELLKLRVDVFVVEQACAYPELDDKDMQSDVWHLLGYQDQSLIAYARLLAPGISYPSASIGRVATQQQARGNGLGRKLLDQALVECQHHWPEHDIEIGAQHYLASFYQSYGFQPTSAVYLEDGIPHIDMKLVK